MSAAEQLTLPRAAEHHELKPRRVRFDWEHTPMEWVPGDPLSTHAMNVLHLLLPAGEKWFVHVYRQALPLVTDPQVAEDGRGFMGQEAVHSRAHSAVLDHLRAQGLDAEPFTRHMDFLFEKLLGDEILGRKPPRFLARRFLEQRLAIVAAIEHFTAVLGMWVIDTPGLDAANCDPVMLDLLRWHGAEEVEHRSVAFDMFQHVSGSYVRRVIAMMQVAPVLVLLWIRGTRFLIAHDPNHPPKGRWRDFFRAGRAGRLPTLRLLMAAIPRYLRHGYHPSQEGDTAMALAYLAGSPAVQAISA
jgi:predicted metal-dependent hydrolase